MLKIEDLNVCYGKNRALQGVSLEVADGEIVALLGRNGAGKTTLLKTVVGLLKAESGKVIIDRNDVTGWPADKIVQLGIGYVPQEGNIFPGLTVMENLRTRLMGQRVEERRLNEIIEIFPQLKDKLSRIAGTLSGGEQKMANIARAFVTDQKLFLMDEPMGGLMPSAMSKIQKAIESMAEEGVSVLLVEQAVKTALECADKAYIMERGVIEYKGDPKKLTEDTEILRRYLGIMRASS